MRSSCLRSLVPATAGLLFLGLSPLHAEEARTWTDTQGRELTGVMTGVDATNGSIQIQRPDGSVANVPIAMLSEEDRNYAKTRWQEMQSSPSAAPSPEAATPPPAAAATVPAMPPLERIPLDKFEVPEDEDYLRSSSRERPRLLHDLDFWRQMVARMGTDLLLAELYSTVYEGGVQLEDTPELTRVYGDQNNRVTPASKALYRVAALGTLYYLDQDPSWPDRAIRGLMALCDPSTFPDWYPVQPRVTADFVFAAALGYDWFHAQMNEQQRETLRNCLVTQGIEPLMAVLKAAPDPKQAPTVEHFACAASLIFASLCLADEEPEVVKKATKEAAEMFGEGLLHFAPTGLWPNGPDDGDQVLDYAVMVLQSLRSIRGDDFGFSRVEGFPKIGSARMHLIGPTGRLFDYGDTSATSFLHPWTSSWLSGVHGNPGLPPVKAGKPQGPDSAFLGNSGYVLYHNPQAAGQGPAAPLEAVFPGAELAMIRSAWSDRNAYYVAFKGGDTEELHSQLDHGTFVLDAGGQRWAIELGAESDRVAAATNYTNRPARYALYVKGTQGQNTVSFGGNQSMDAQSEMVGLLSTPERGAAVLDLSDVYSRETQGAQRGLMVVRGAEPFVLLQDELNIKNTQTVHWKMHTRAEVVVEDRKATLTQGNQTLTAFIVSPENAVFTVEDAPEQTTPQKSLRGIRVLKTLLSGVKGEQRLTVSFALGDQPKQAPIVPLEDWTPQR